MATNNVLNNLIYGCGGAINLSGTKFPTGFGFGIAANSTADLYTAPTGKRAAVYPSYGANGSATPAGMTYQPKIKVSGTYYNIGISSTSNMSQLLMASNLPIILEPGESASVNFAAGSTTSNTYGFPIVEFDSNMPFKTAKLTTLASGNNTLYTCPANTRAIILDTTLGIGNGTSPGQLYYVNNSGGAITRQWYIVNSAGSPGTTNSTSLSASISNGSIDTAGNACSCLNAGDTIVINVSAATATQFAWVNIMEVPA